MQAFLLFVVSLALLFTFASANVLSLNFADNATDIPQCIFEPERFSIGGTFSIFNDRRNTCNFAYAGPFGMYYNYNADKQLCFFPADDPVCRNTIGCLDSNECETFEFPQSSDFSIKFAAQWRETGNNTDISSSNVVSIISLKGIRQPVCSQVDFTLQDSTSGTYSIFSDNGTCNYLDVGFVAYYYKYNNAGELCISFDSLCEESSGSCTKANSCNIIEITLPDGPLAFAVRWQQTSGNIKSNVLSLHVDEEATPSCNFTANSSIPTDEISGLGNYSIFSNPNTCNFLATGNIAFFYTYLNNSLCVTGVDPTCNVSDTSICAPADTCKVIRLPVNPYNETETLLMAVQWQGAVGPSPGSSTSSSATSSSTSSPASSTSSSSSSTTSSASSTSPSSTSSASSTSPSSTSSTSTSSSSSSTSSSAAITLASLSILSIAMMLLLL